MIEREADELDLAHPVPGHWTVGRGRDAYLAENGFTVAGYDAPWTPASLLGIRFSVPNTPRHRWAILRHDLHHVATGYGTDFVGEAEISAWECRGGLRALGLYTGAIVFGLALGGLVRAPRRVLRAWRAASGRPSLFRDGDPPYDALLGMQVSELRNQLGIPASGLATQPRCLHERAPRPAVVTSVSAGARHGPHKDVRSCVRLLTGRGVEGDAHLGETVQHRSRVAVDPSQPNRRQVHLMHAELHDELRRAGFDASAGAMGENVTTRGLDLLALPAGTKLRLGEDAVVEITGLRNPCRQLDELAPGLMAATLERDTDGRLVRKAGVMAIVVRDGEVRAGDRIRTELPPEPHVGLAPV